MAAAAAAAAMAALAPAAYVSSGARAGSRFLVQPPERQQPRAAALRGSLAGQDVPAAAAAEAVAVGQSDRRKHKRRGGISSPQVMAGLFGGLFGGGDPAEATAKKYATRVAEMNSLEPAVSALSDEALRSRTGALKKRLEQGETLDDILPEAFAVAREASKRVLGLWPFDVQLIGGIILHEGRIAEMRTGEGKTLVAVLPSYLNALAGNGVHVVTVNDYLARRDCEWVGQVARFLGLKVGLVQSGMVDEQRRAAYACDVTYVTNSELGFDYLRDNLAQNRDNLVLRNFNYCIIDEVDSILIDEARTPLIISGSAAKPSDKYIKAAKLAKAFIRDVHYTVDEKQKSVVLTEEGYEAAEDILQVSDLYDPRHQWALFVINALKAKELQLRDVNYIVRSGEAMIVDEFTGRVLPGRRWSEGLHQAVEAKEGVKIQDETVTLASISYQNFFLQFPKRSGMTGTAATEKGEFKAIYGLDVEVVPTHRTVSRQDFPDVVFRTAEGKWGAVASEVARMHKNGRPVLVGTTSVEQSEQLSALLNKKRVPHRILNAKPENVEREAEIVAQSGRKGAVTIATNMAGRGTDIILGGNAEFMAKLKLRELLMPRVVRPPDDQINFENGVTDVKPRKSWATSPDLYPCELSARTLALANEAVDAAASTWGKESTPELEVEDRLAVASEKGPLDDSVLKKLRDALSLMQSEYAEYARRDREEVVTLGGLHVVGTERHESRRIDNQLRGRSGRQGDPGSTRYFLALTDNLFRIFGGDRIQALMTAFRVDDLPIESGMLSKSLDEAQRKVETYFYDIRKQLFEYDEVLNSQREKLYYERRRALLADDLSEQMVEFADATMDDILQANVDSSLKPDQWELDDLSTKLKQYCYLLDGVTAQTLRQAARADYETLRDHLHELGRNAYYYKRTEVEAVEKGLMDEAERFFVLSQTDKLWQDHLQSIKFVQQAVGLRGYAQRDPLTEYKLEGYNLFAEMMAQIRRNVIYSVYQFRPVVRQATVTNEGDIIEYDEATSSNSSTSPAAAESSVADVANSSRPLAGASSSSSSSSSSAAAASAGGKKGNSKRKGKK